MGADAGGRRVPPDDAAVRGLFDDRVRARLAALTEQATARV